VPDDAATYPTERKDEGGDVEARAVSCPDEEPGWIISKDAMAALEDVLAALRTGDPSRAVALLVSVIRRSIE
jgi:hypothetical protein